MYFYSLPNILIKNLKKIILFELYVLIYNKNYKLFFNKISYEKLYNIIYL